MQQRGMEDLDHRISTIRGSIPEIWSHVLGIPRQSVSTDPQANILVWIEEAGADLFDSMGTVEWAMEVESNYAVDVFAEAGPAISRIDPASSLQALVPGERPFDMTNEQLWRWIAMRMDWFSFEPVNIAGTLSPSAGAFFGIRDLLGSVDPDLEIAPSTPIASVLSGQKLSMFWRRLEAHSRRAVPGLKWPYRSFASAVTLAGLMVGVIGLFTFALHWGALWLLKAGGWATFAGIRLSNDCRLPAGVVTFGDLARLVADRQQAIRE